MRITHLFTTFRNMGGVESNLRHHWAHDQAYGIQSQFISYQERPDPPVDRVEFLGFDEKSTIKQIRRDLRMTLAKQRPEVCVYHGTWVVKYLADIDLADRRILFLHGTHTACGDIQLEVGPWADGLAGVSRAQYDGFLNALPLFDRARTELLNCPIFPPTAAPIHQPIKNRPFVIGYSGRLADDAKRVDRAPALLKALDETNLDYRMEFLGEGPLEPHLKEQFRNNSRITFHGRKSGDAYWNVIRNWDFFVLFSDSEGTPISILETMNQGVLPIMPGINSGADFYAGQLGTDFVYPPYDFTVATEIIRKTLSRPENEIQTLRRSAAEIVGAHRADAYFRAFVKFLERIRSMPRRSSIIPKLPPWPLQSVQAGKLASLKGWANRLKSTVTSTGRPSR